MYTHVIVTPNKAKAAIDELENESERMPTFYTNVKCCKLYKVLIMMMSVAKQRLEYPSAALHVQSTP